MSRRVEWTFSLLGATLAACHGPAAISGAQTGGDQAANHITPDAASSPGDAASVSEAAEFGEPTTDGASAEVAAEVEDASIECDMEVGSCPVREAGRWAVLADAAQFGPNAVLVAMGGQAVLVAVADGTHRVALLRDSRDFEMTTPEYVSWPVSTNGLSPVAVAHGRLPGMPLGSGGLFVLACGEASSGCRLFHNEIVEGELGVWQDTALPEEFAAQGVVFDGASAEVLSVCVYGGGLLCFDGKWHEAIAPSPELSLMDVSIGHYWSLAVGAHGRWFKRERSDANELGTWQEQVPLEDVLLTQSSVSGRGGTVVGEGQIAAALGTQREFYACGTSVELAAVLLHPTVDGLGFAVAQSGAILRRYTEPFQTEPYCRYDERALGEIIDTGSSPCDDGLNPRVLTEKVLWGQNECVRLIGE